jgi:hypothetical protein
MKKIIVIALLVVAIAGFGDSWLSVDFGFSAFYSPSQTVANKFYSAYEPDHPIYAPYDATFSIDFTAFSIFKAGASWENNFSDSIGNFMRFSPCDMEFVTYAGIEPFKGLFFKYEHKCVHAFFPYYPDNEFAYDKFGVEIKGHLDF